MRPGYVMSSVWNWLDSGPLYWRKTSMQLQRIGAKKCVKIMCVMGSCNIVEGL